MKNIKNYDEFKNNEGLLSTILKAGISGMKALGKTAKEAYDKLDGKIIEGSFDTSKYGVGKSVLTVILVDDKNIEQAQEFTKIGVITETKQSIYTATARDATTKTKLDKLAIGNNTIAIINDGVYGKDEEIAITFYTSVGAAKKYKFKEGKVSTTTNM